MDNKRQDQQQRGQSNLNDEMDQNTSRSNSSQPGVKQDQRQQPGQSQSPSTSQGQRTTQTPNR